VCTFTCVFNVCIYKFFTNTVRKHNADLGPSNRIQERFLVDMELHTQSHTRSVNKVMRLIQYNSVLTFKLQIEFFPFKIVPLGGHTPPETLFPLFIATLVVANRNRF